MFGNMSVHAGQDERRPCCSSSEKANNGKRRIIPPASEHTEDGCSGVDDAKAVFSAEEKG